MKMFEYTPEEKERLRADPRFKLLGEWVYFPDETDETTYTTFSIEMYRGVFIADVYRRYRGHTAETATYPIHMSEDAHLFYYFRKTSRVEFLLSEQEQELMVFPEGKILQRKQFTHEHESQLTS